MDKTALDILNTIMYATISTTDNDSAPWAAPQFIAYDPNVNEIYWCADRGSQHAKNILNNHRAFVVVYDSSVGPGQGKGVYFRTNAQMVGNFDEAAAIMKQLIARHGGVPYWTLDDIRNPDSFVKVFKATIEEAWINDGREQDGRFVLYRKPINLS